MPPGVFRAPGPNDERAIGKIFLKKFVIARHRAHIYKRLNLLPKPKRHLQRFGFVHLWAVPALVVWQMRHFLV